MTKENRDTGIGILEELKSSFFNIDD